MTALKKSPAGGMLARMVPLSGIRPRGFQLMLLQEDQQRYKTRITVRGLSPYTHLRTFGSDFQNHPFLKWGGITSPT